MADGDIRINTRPVRAADLFCGAGGLTTGAERALRKLGRKVLVTAINHWQIAIDTHTRNHPGARHLCTDLEHVKPLDAVPEGVLDLLMAAPSCVFHSRARGGRPVHDQQRMDPWHVVRWCTELRVHRLIVENVPEFMQWGPCSLTTGRPIPSRRGEYFRAWCDALRAIGFRIDWRVLCCADYGDATTRERFFLIGRSDRGALRWPSPTHARGGTTDLLGTLPRWRSAAECIDWTIPGRSIFGRRKPLASNTIKRLLAGAERYDWPEPHCEALRALLAGRESVLDLSAEQAAPFLIHLRGTSDAHLRAAAHSVGDPLGTLTAGGTHVGLVMATGAGGVARALDQPLPTITAGGDGGARPHYATPIIVHRCNSDGGRNARPVSEPAPTVATRGAGYLAEPIIAPYYGQGSGETAKPASDPLPSITTKARFGIGTPVVFPITHHGDSRVRGAEQPLPTITGANRGELALGHPFLVPNFGERPGQDPRTHDVGEPLPAITASGHIQLAQATVWPPARIDVLYRMLHWRELSRATSFHHFDETYDFAGNATEITKQIGNAVPGCTGEALVAALCGDMA